MEGKVIAFIATYTLGIFYASYRSLKNQPYVPIEKMKWV